MENIIQLRQNDDHQITILCIHSFQIRDTTYKFIIIVTIVKDTSYHAIPRDYYISNNNVIVYVLLSSRNLSSILINNFQ